MAYLNAFHVLDLNFFFFPIAKNADTLKLNTLFLSISFIAISEVR